MRKAMSKFSILVFLLVVVLGLTGAVSAEEDWDAIIAAAKQEGEVAFYTLSSRAEGLAQSFEQKYGIRVNWTKMNDVEISDRVIREVDAGIRAVDVVAGEDLAVLFAQLLPGGYLTSYVPSTHKDIVPVEYQDPLFFNFHARIIGYNNEFTDKSPIESLWDLTLPEWRGKFMMRDPQLTATHLAWFAEIVEHADEMAEEYERRFGEPITLTTANAGWEFIKRLAKNRPIMFSSDTSVSDAVGARGQTDAPVGLYVLSKHRDIVEKNLALAAAYDIKPVMGYFYPGYLLMVRDAPHPNAAKLLIRFLLEEEGIDAWVKDLGSFSVNPNVPPHPEDPLKGMAGWLDKTWVLDPETAIKHWAEVFDFWMLHLQ